MQNNDDNKNANTCFSRLYCCSFFVVQLSVVRSCATIFTIARIINVWERKSDPFLLTRTGNRIVLMKIDELFGPDIVASHTINV